MRGRGEQTGPPTCTVGRKGKVERAESAMSLNGKGGGLPPSQHCLVYLSTTGIVSPGYHARRSPWKPLGVARNPGPNSHRQ